MPEVESYKIPNGFDKEQIASIVYGNQLIEDDSPSDYPYTGAWIISPKKISRMARYKNTAFVNQEESDASIIDLPENRDPTTQATLLNSEENQVQELIFRIKTSRSISYRESLANRILALFKDAKEEDPDCIGIAVESFRNFYNFIQLHTNIKCPIISLTPEYNIYASWRGKKNQVFSIHFLPNADVRFVMFKPNDRHPERKIRISGLATTDIIMETLTPYYIKDWVSE
ncbi:MAG: hypothetical protein BMS9Abin03_357 [Thermodesulfobacteriota bacterium]|nr:MAG: hypothetical protein BMS9Abin03_357 [Thermodesulfobacteriota bacterium]